MNNPKLIATLKSDVSLLRQQLANSSIALKFLSDTGVSESAKEYIRDILKLSEQVIAATEKEKYSARKPVNQEGSSAFLVMAGKYDADEANCKYSVEHNSLSAAIEDYDKVRTYPWAFIEFNGRVLDVRAAGCHPLGVNCAY